MKKILFAILAGAFLTGNAQITLTSDDAPQIGNIFYNVNDTSVSDTVTPGPEGENVVWDFSILDSAFMDTLSYVNAADIPQSEDYTEATIARITSADTTFFNVSTDEMILLGMLTGGYEIIYDDPLTTMRYPFTYNSCYTDTGHFSLTIAYDTTVNGVHIDSVNIDRRTISTDSCLAYGQLILPNETFDNVLMNKNNSVIHDSISIHTDMPGWMNVRDTTYKRIAFAVYKKAYGNSLLTLYLNDDGTINTAVYKYGEATYASNVNLIDIKLYPNPAHNNITVTVPEANSDVSIINANGQVVFSKEFNSNKFDVDITSLPAGNYLIKVKTNKGSIVKKFVKK